MSHTPDGRLRRAIRLPHATALVVGTIIGASIFVQPSEITGRVPSVAGAALVWTLAGVLTLAGALVTAELASIYPKTGGMYVFLREAFGRGLGFLWGWAMFWVIHSGIIAAIAMVFASYVDYLVPLGSTAATKGVAAGVILLISLINYWGVKKASDLQALFTLGKLVAIAGMLGGAFLFGSAAHQVVVASEATAGPGLLGGGTGSDFTLALVAALFAYGGWHMVTYTAEETVDPQRTIPLAMTWGLVIVTVAYVLLNTAYFHVLPIETVIASDRIAADAADAVLGFGGGQAMAALVVFSTFGALAGIVLAGPRVYYAMAQDGLLFRWVAELHPEHGTPHRAIALQGLWAMVLAVTESYRVLFTRVIYTEWIFFGLMALGLIIFRSRGQRGAYRVWGYPWTPLLFSAAAFAIVLHQIFTDPVESVVGLGIVALGLPVFAIWLRKAPPPPGISAP